MVVRAYFKGSHLHGLHSGAASTLPQYPARVTPASSAGIEGAGTYGIQSTELTVGGNDLSTEMSGDLYDGTFAPGSLYSGSLVKIGSGALTLSGISTYTGTTTVNDGVLRVDGSIATSSGVTVKIAGTLSGSGEVGNVVVKSGGALSPGASAGKPHTGAITFKAGASFAVELGGETASTGAGHHTR